MTFLWGLGFVLDDSLYTSCLAFIGLTNVLVIIVVPFILLHNSMRVLLISVKEGWRRNAISQENKQSPDREIWFSESLETNPLKWVHLLLTTLHSQSIQPHSPVLRGRAHSLPFFILSVVTRSFQRTQSPHKVSAFPQRKYNLQYIPKCSIILKKNIFHASLQEKIKQSFKSSIHSY